VFVIMLSDVPYAQAFGPASTAPYVTGTLEHRGELLAHYDAVAHEELANGVALLSGQGPTTATASNCPTYTAIAPAGIGASEQVQGTGCVYPQATRTLLGQLTEKHLAWRAYVGGIDEPGAPSGACAHPQPGTADPTAEQTASTGPYATFRNPAVYFASITGSPACAREDVGMNALKGDLSKARSTPSFSYIVPDRCHDGNPTPCRAGAPAGMSAAGSFLSTVVPQITGSAAYREAGMLVITTDEAPSSGEYGDSSSCCGQPRFPNLAPPPGGLSPRGGGSVGALLLSPWVQGGTTSQEPLNHFSLLRTIEEVFSLHPIGYAALPAVKPLEPSLFTASPSH
jgi:phosphatidylinositol-3-phosphatase